jgi:hypothetical protein
VLTRGVLILVAADVLFANTPTVPVRASCVWLAGQAAWIAAVESGAFGGGATGAGATRGRSLSCEVCTVGVGRGFERGASTVTCGNVVSGCAGVPAGGEDVSDCAEGGSRAGAAGGGAGSVAAGGDAGWVAGAAGGEAG